MTEKLTDERLRDAFASREPVPVPGVECSDADTIWRAVRGELAHDRIRQVGLHTTSCAACAEAWRLAVEVSRETPADVIPFGRPARRAGRARAWWIGGTTRIPPASAFSVQGSRNLFSSSMERCSRLRPPQVFLSCSRPAT